MWVGFAEIVFAKMELDYFDNKVLWTVHTATKLYIRNRNENCFLFPFAFRFQAWFLWSEYLLWEGLLHNWHGAIAEAATHAATLWDTLLK